MIPIDEPRAIGGHAWPPDGGDILALRPGVDSAPRPIAATPAEELAPVIAPDGRWT